MSLQVWLPLTGDLRNQGLSDIEFTNSNATIDNNGKIGKCYYFNASAYLKESAYDWTNFNTSEFSLCCWYKEPSPVASGNSQIICIGTSSGWNNIRIGLLRRTSNGYPMFSVSNGSSAVQYNCTATTFTLDTWNHIACIYKNGEIKIYLNGILNKTYTTTIIPILNSSQHLGIGAASNGAEKLTGYLNDVRIYDHALSDKEVEEIAKGLVLHYKLDNDGLGNKNILPISMNLTKWSKESGVSVEWDSNKNMYKIITTGKTSSRWGIYQNITLTANTTYTFSVDGMKVDQACAFGFAEGNAWPSNAGSFTTDRQRLSKTITVGSADAICRIYLNVTCINGGTNNAYFALPKLEVGEVATDWSPAVVDGLTTDNIVYDSSGYQNNGESNSNISTNTDTARYFTSSYFGEYNAPNIILQNPSILSSLNNCTICWWGKYDTTKTLLLTGQSTSVYLAASNNNTFYHAAAGSPIMYKNGIQGTYKCVAGSWDFYVLKNVDLSTWTTMKINSYGSGWPLKGLLSDFRIYATELTDEQILDLYHTSASIDKEGNVYARELVEE